MASNCCLCTFRLRHLWFGIAVEKVQEVSWTPILTPVPLALPSVAGLVNLRGQIITAFDLCRRLDFPQTAVAVWPAMVVVRNESVQLALLVDEIGEVVEPSDDVFEAAPSNLRGKCRELLPRVCKFPGRLLPVLDLDRILQRYEPAESGSLEGDASITPMELAGVRCRHPCKCGVQPQSIGLGAGAAGKRADELVSQSQDS